jgi:hypothetical protein
MRIFLFVGASAGVAPTHNRKSVIIKYVCTKSIIQYILVVPVPGWDYELRDLQQN